MFNLRDLIYSQTQSSQWSVPDAPLPLPMPWSSNTDKDDGALNSQTQSSIWTDLHQPRGLYEKTEIAASNNEYDDDIESEELADEAPSSNDRPISHKRLKKLFDKISDLPSFIRSHPENLYKNILHSDYTPGMSTFIKFPADQPSLSDKRRLLRVLWRECYYAQDYQGALMTLKYSSDKQRLHLSDIYMLIDILRRSRNAGELLQKFIDIIISSTPHSIREYSRPFRIGFFVDAFASAGDVSSIKALFHERLMDPSYCESFTFISASALVLCHQCSQEAQNLLKFILMRKEAFLFDSDCSLEIPNMREILRDPSKFYKSVYIVYKQNESIDAFLASSDLSNSDLTALKKLVQTCKTLIQELKSGFTNVVRFRPYTYCAFDLDLLYVAFLRGCDQEEQAWEYLTSTISDIERDNNSTLSLDSALHDRTRWLSTYRRYLRVCMCYIAEIEFASILNGTYTKSSNLEPSNSYSSNDIASKRSAIQLLKEISTKFVLTYIFPSGIQSLPPIPSIDAVVIGNIMYLMGEIKKHDFIRLLCEFIESSQPISGFTSTDFDTASYIKYVWNLVASVLGPIKSTPSLIDPLPSSSNLFQYFDNGHWNGDSFIDVALSVSPQIERINQQPHLTPDVLLERLWWEDSILSPFQIGNFMSYVKESHVLSVIEILSMESSHQHRNKLSMEELESFLISLSGNSGLRANYQEALRYLIEEHPTQYFDEKLHVHQEFNSFDRKIIQTDCKNGNSIECGVMVGIGFLAQLSSMILVSCHMFSQDSAFTVIGIQTLIANYLHHKISGNSQIASAIVGLLTKLQMSGVNIHRAGLLGEMLSIKNANVFESYGFCNSNAHSDISLSGHPFGRMYNPL